MATRGSLKLAKHIGACLVRAACIIIPCACGGGGGAAVSPPELPGLEGLGPGSVTSGLFPVQVTASTQSACKPGTRSVGGSMDPGTLAALELGDVVILTHRDARYACDAEVTLAVTVTGREIQGKESIVKPGDQTGCTCAYDLSVRVQNLPPGAHTVRVTDARGGSVEAITLQVKGLVLTVSDFKQGPDAIPPPEGTAAVDEVLAVSDPVRRNTLVIQHRYARYTCTAKLKLEAALSGRDVLVRDVITVQGEPSDALCSFTLSFKVGGLPGGEYGVRLYDAANNPVAQRRTPVSMAYPGCRPYCGAIGTASEGWYDGCDHQLLSSSAGHLSGPCAECTLTCEAIGSGSEGWYTSCKNSGYGGLVKYDFCH